jgi:molecular chaperone DnaK (HSP70)
LYNTRNAVQEEKVKESLGDSTVKEVSEWVTEGLAWLEDHPDESKEAYESKKKEYEDKIRPIMTKLYESSGIPSQGQSQGQSQGPDVEEVD